MASFQVTGWNTHHHIAALTRAGVFEGHQAARTVLLWFGMNVAVSDRPKQGLQRGFVMRGCISQKSVCANTGLSQSAVSKAMAWLADQGLVSVRYSYANKRQHVQSVEIQSYDEQSEADRLAWLADQPVPAPKLRVLPGGYSSGITDDSSGMKCYS
jgi:hypothetical protein